MTGRRPRRPAVARCDERGFTLPELLIATVIGLLVVGSGVMAFTSGISTQPKISDRAARIQQARTMAERISREVRQGSNASSASPGQLTLLTYVPRTTCGGSTVGPATRCRIFYSCASSGSCTRQECPPNLTVPGPGCGTATVAVQGLASNSVFTFSPRAPGQAFVTIALSFPARGGDDAITIQDGAALRNPPLGSE